MLLPKLQRGFRGTGSGLVDLEPPTDLQEQSLTLGQEPASLRRLLVEAAWAVLDWVLVQLDLHRHQGLEDVVDGGLRDRGKGVAHSGLLQDMPEDPEDLADLADVVVQMIRHIVVATVDPALIHVGTRHPLLERDAQDVADGI